MERFEISLRALSPRGGTRPRRRPLPFDQELAAVGKPSTAAPASLSGYIPNSLIPTEMRMAALVIGGAPAWSRRLRRIDALTDAALRGLELAWRELAQGMRGQPAEFAREWRAHAQRTDFARVNELIRRHNLYFPAEASLAMDVHTGDYIGLGGGDYRRQSLDAAWVLERFPPVLSAALGD